MRLLLAFLIGLLLVLSSHKAHAQRFLREGSQMAAENRAEIELDDEDSLSGMTREMFLLQDVTWELQPPSCIDTSALLKDNKSNKKVASHVKDYLQEPIRLRLLRRNGKYGLRAVGTTPSGKKIRAFWRQSSPTSGARLKTSDLLEASYDDAVRSRLFCVDFELQLPRTTNNKKSSKIPPPSIVYQVAVEAGSMNPKAMIARGDGKVKVYPAREKGLTADKEAIPVGSAKVGLTMKPGLVDPNWARGRSILRLGRSTGFV